MRTRRDTGEDGSEVATVGLAGLWPRVLDMAGPVYVAATDGRILDSNAAFDDLIRPLYAPGDALPAGLSRQAARGRRTVRRLETVNGARGPRVFEGRHRYDGDHGCLIGVYQEVTRAEEALEKLRGLRAHTEEVLATVSDWVWRVDAAWTFRESSARDPDQVGFDPTSVLDCDFFTIGETVEDPRTGARATLHRERRAPFRGVLYRVPGNDGAARLFELTAIPVFDAGDGGFAGFRGSARDVTREIAATNEARAHRASLEDALADLHRKNAELDEALTKARDADRAKNAFLAMVGHELRTPLNAIIGFAEMMENETLGPLGNEHYKNYVADIVSSSRHLLGVINDILDVVKLEMDEIKLQLDDVRVGKLIETCMTLVREKAHTHNIALETEVAEGTGELVADPQKLRQMLVNLLSNAIKFTPVGGRVTVAARRTDEGGHELSVSDTGPGIPDDQIAELLEPFKQGDDSLARQHEGLGLGLPLTKRLVEAHGGRMDIASEVGAGTRIALIFPPNVAEVARTG